MKPFRGAGDLRVAIAIDPELAPGLLANTVATISVGLGAVHPGLAGIPLTDRMERTIFNSCDRPIPILSGSDEQLQTLLMKALDASDKVTAVAFPQFARSLHSFSEYEERFPEVDLSQEPLAGIGLCGPQKPIRSLTGSMKLLR